MIKTKKYWLLMFVLIISLVLVACGGEESEPVAEVDQAVELAESTPGQIETDEAAEESAPEVVSEPAEEEIEPVEQEVVPEEEASVLEESEIDALFAAFLGKMVKYNTTGLDTLNEQIISGAGPFLLDVRQPEELVEKGHIEGAINIPLRELGQNTDLLPAFDTPIVSYCGSGWRCTIAMTELGALGWDNVLSLKGGSFGGWAESGYPIVEGAAPEAELLNVVELDPALQTLMDETLSTIPEGWGVITNEQLNTELAENPDLVVIDVRRAEEVAEKGYIEAENTVHIPLEEFIAQKELWPADKDTPIAIYCGSGHRSTMAMTILSNYGYDNVRSLKGGFGAWVEAGYPVAGGVAALDEAYTDFLANMVKYNTIGLDALNEQLIEDPPPYLLDVRQPEELEEKGHIESAVNIPLRELGKHTDLLPSFETPSVSYCGSGWRCTIAMTALGALGWEDILSLKGGSYGGWLEAGYPIVEGAAEEPLVLNVADPDPALLAIIDETLSTIPEGWGVITVDQLNTELAENPDLVVIDVRRAEEVAEKGYIESENTIHIPLEEFIVQKELWPADKDTPIAIYCGSGHRSTMAMTILWSYGYENVRSLKGGFGSWVEAGYPVAGGVGALDEAYAGFLANMVKYNTTGLDALNEQLIEDPPPFLLDVRQPEELDEKGHIESAVNIPLRELGKNIDLLPSFETPSVSYCGSGWRCTIAMTAMGALGWQDILSLKGGSYGGWLEAGYPIVEGAAEEALVLNAAEPDPALVTLIDKALSNIPDGWGGITAEQLNTELAENPDLVVIDVRRTEELEENGIIEAANFIHIPLEDFISQKELWPADKSAPIAIYCGSGHRSTMAMTILWSYGYEDVRSLKSGFGGWVDSGYPTVEYEAMSS
jgi:rhodanese-related sulfurtransferase